MDNQSQQQLKVRTSIDGDGTKNFTKFTLQKASRTNIQGRRSLVYSKPEINLMDSKGQITFDARERKQIDLLIEGRVKNHVNVKQRDKRLSHLLWEFWKHDSELFPSEILSTEVTNKPNSIVLVFDGGNLQGIQFYHQLIEDIIKLGYPCPLVALTKLDNVEKKYPDESVRQEVIDSRIKLTVNSLGIPRKNVHYIENHHKRMKDQVPVNYYALRLLEACLSSTLNQNSFDQQFFCQFI